MTVALCICCGELKFGAFCPCDKCKVSSSGNKDVDVAFTDHFHSPETLEEFGAVIKKMKSVCRDTDELYWCFVYWVLKNHPGILKGSLDPELEEQIVEILGDIELPKVTLRKYAKSYE